MSATFNRSEILKAAHFYASWHKASGMKGAYREIFARELAAQWKKAKAARARFEQNTGLRFRSCPADAPARRTYSTPSAAAPLLWSRRNERRGGPPPIQTSGV
jgi:hypothetical protein